MFVSSPSLDELKNHYPPAAERDGVDGDVQIMVTLDEVGRATDTPVLSETLDACNGRPTRISTIPSAPTK
jgi:hypothetical protein